ncbi:hypothetical protein KFL_002490070 [Klebsormidium nitens]|uniref:Disease resistance R13L4/SHOC-2-like LRR domain-containing protein n=1 Tax=Klebsormidium nitens TaxID=105231 RepID=A0A1Y1I8E3_KLENI|nr:hypothetical protein KFL_002490070 [Klebsormidium nitens]|eukprot:GAQ85689.1 hypothetical protein KFL_002490070 [Klebsormidium nitens]
MSIPQWTAFAQSALHRSGHKKHIESVSFYSHSRRETCSARTPLLVGRRVPHAGKHSASGWKETCIKAGSLIENLDAEVASLQESESSSEETLTEVRRRVGEAESSGKLDLSGLRLTELPSDVFDLTGLTELSLAGNCLAELDPDIGRLTNLAKLGLAGNNLRGLPAEIGALKYLKGLWVHGNLLESLPPQIGKLKYLGILALGGNRLTTLPEEIGCLTSLQSLSVPGNRLTSLDALACGRPLPELKALGLFGNCLREVPEGVLGRLPGLTELWLQGNALTQLSGSPSDWAALKALKQLSVADNDLTSLPDALASLPSLKDLWVYGNRLQTLPLTLVEMPKLAHLWLEGNPLESDALGEALLRLPLTGKWARKVVVGIDTQQARGLKAEIWESAAVSECVKVSTLAGNGGDIGKREGYFKLDHGVPFALGGVGSNSETDPEKVGEGATERDGQGNGQENGTGPSKSGGQVGEERGDALIFSYMSMMSGAQSRVASEQTGASVQPSESGAPFSGASGKIVLEGRDGQEKVGSSSDPERDPSTSTGSSASSGDGSEAGAALPRGNLGDQNPRGGLVVVAFGSAPGVPNWAGVLKRVKAALKPDATKKKSSSKAVGPSLESTTFDVLYVVDARRSWYTQVGSPGGATNLAASETGAKFNGCNCPPEEESEGEGANASGADDLQLEGDFRIGTSGHVSERDGRSEKVRSKVASRSTLLDARDLGIARVSSRDPLAADGTEGQPSGASRESGREQVFSAGPTPQSSGEHNGSAGNGAELGGSGLTNGSERKRTGQRLSGYYRAELEAAVSGYERVLLLGDSMGASASLLFSSLATRVLSFCPQVDLSTASIRCAEDAAWFRSFRAEVLDDVSRSSAVITVHCGCWLHDLEQAALLPAGKVTVVEHPVEDHRLAKELDYQRKLVPILRTAIEEELMLLTLEQGRLGARGA